MQTILGTDDAVNTCDCCGKSNLKFTFAVDVDGEVLHYGSTCVTKWTGCTAAQANKEVADRAAADKAAKEKTYRATIVAIRLEAKMNEAHKLGLMGKTFKDFCTVERVAADACRAAIFA